MGRRYKGPYLFLHHRPNNRSAWVIRDGERWTRTGCLEHEREEAERQLAEYASGLKKLPKDWTAEAPRPVIRQVMVYFISSEDVLNYPIKIGQAFGSLDDRLQQLQTACPYRLRLLLVLEGNSFLERILHDQFRDSRMMGEWFARTPELMTFIETKLNEASEEDAPVLTRPAQRGAA